MSDYDEEDWQSTYDEIEGQRASLEFRARSLLRVHAYDDRRSNSPVDWTQVLSGELPERQYLAGDLFEVGQQVSLIGEGKVGKSILALDLVRALSGGRPFLGAPVRPSVHVGYFDMENDLRTLAERAISLGMTEEDFQNVTYLSFPSIAPLDTPLGGEMLMEEVEKWQMKVVFLDTVSRFIEGRENDADTWLAFYRCTGVHLKANNVALVRLDHMGKDASRGGRGSSAKTQDVDHVYELLESSGRGPGKHLSLRRTFTRSGGGSEERAITRLSSWDKERRLYLPGETKHVYHGEEVKESPLALPEKPPALPTLSQRASEMVDALDHLGVAYDTSFRKSAAVLRGNNETVSDKDLQAACRFRKKRGPDFYLTPFATPVATPSPHLSDHSGPATLRHTSPHSEEPQVSDTATPSPHLATPHEKSQAEGVALRGARVSVPRGDTPEGPDQELDHRPVVPPPTASDE